MSGKYGIACIMDETAVKEAIQKMSQQIIKNHNAPHKLCIIGIRRRGVAIAKNIFDTITELSGGKEPFLGELDVTLYRDDLATLKELPVFFSTNIPFDINNQKVLIVDDVLYTGRTVRAALDALFLLGRPSKIELAVLIDRGHRELPIKADYIGETVRTTDIEYARVKTPRYDGESAVYLQDQKNTPT